MQVSVTKRHSTNIPYLPGVVRNARENGAVRYLMRDDETFMTATGHLVTTKGDCG